MPTGLTSVVTLPDVGRRSALLAVTALAPVAFKECPQDPQKRA